MVRWPPKATNHATISTSMMPSMLVSYLILILNLLSSVVVMSMSVPKNIVIVGGGIQGTSVAYHLALATTTAAASSSSTMPSITILESEVPASAASGKGGGFMARSWGDGSPTQTLHHLGFDMYAQLAPQLGCTSYRKIPVLSVAPGSGNKGDGIALARKGNNKQLAQVLPDWLDGKVGRISALGLGDDTAQITPREYVMAMLKDQESRIKVVQGATCTGVETEQSSEPGGNRKVTAVKYINDKNEKIVLPSDCVVVSAGPWSCAAEDWFQGALKLPMEGVKSTSIVWKSQEQQLDATALFCGEDNRFGTHLEVYPRPDGTIYICGIGGSDYVPTDELKQGAFRSQCDANPSRVDAAMKSFQEMSATYKQNGELDRSQACMRPCPPDAMPYMGRIPLHEGAYINAGHNCWGIAWAPACGKSMAELILNGKSTCVDLDPFDPARFTPASSQRGGRGRKKQGDSIGEQW